MSTANKVHLEGDDFRYVKNNNYGEFLNKTIRKRSAYRVKSKLEDKINGSSSVAAPGRQGVSKAGTIRDVVPNRLLLALMAIIFLVSVTTVVLALMMLSVGKTDATGLVARGTGSQQGR